MNLNNIGDMFDAGTWTVIAVIGAIVAGFLLACVVEPPGTRWRIRGIERRHAARIAEIRAAHAEHITRLEDWHATELAAINTAWRGDINEWGPTYIEPTILAPQSEPAAWNEPTGYNRAVQSLHALTEETPDEARAHYAGTYMPDAWGTEFIDAADSDVVFVDMRALVHQAILGETEQTRQVIRSLQAKQPAELVAVGPVSGPPVATFVGPTGSKTRRTYPAKKSRRARKGGRR
jgi:hypothetical protein